MSVWSRIRRRLDPERHEPLLPGLPSGSWWARLVLPRDAVDQVQELDFDDTGHGYDLFGMSLDGVAFGLAINSWIYDHYFRVDSYGHEHIPAEGPVVIACNHSGTLPVDGLMTWVDIVRHGPGGRVPRVVVDHFAPLLPFVNLVFTRAGAIGGSRGNFHAALDAGQIVVVYPEGVPGIGKPFSERYQLKPFREGHAELAIEHQTPIVPMCVIGAEEQWPTLFKLPVRAFGIPYLPVVATPMPMPVHYHLWYGAPIDVAGRFEPSDALDADKVGALAQEVQARVQDLVDHGLSQRRGIFR